MAVTVLTLSGCSIYLVIANLWRWCQTQVQSICNLQSADNNYQQMNVGEQKTGITNGMYQAT